MARRSVGTALVMALTGALLVFVAPQAGAATQPVIKLGPNSSVEIPYPTPIGAGLPFDVLFGSAPEDCADDGLYPEVCDYIPLRLVDEKGDPISAKSFSTEYYALTFTLSWDATNYVIPGTGTAPDTQLKLGVWDDPVVDDPEDEPTECDPEDPIVNFYGCEAGVLAPTGGDPGGDEAYVDTFYFTEAPINFGMVPKRTDYAIVVSNFYGPAADYTLKISLIKSDVPIDLSIDQPLEDLSDIPATPSADIAPPVASLDAAPPAIELGLADIGADSDLDDLGLSDDRRLEQEVATDFARRAVRRDIRPPGDENGFALFFWLVFLPVAIAGGGTAWFLRRRSALFT